ncbi:MAG: hypothetical protein QOJ34_1500 [Pseudonocardiales bacterium]|nr:hypothetical protein [Pseudonocardiales bacterium]
MSMAQRGKSSTKRATATGVIVSKVTTGATKRSGRTAPGRTRRAVPEMVVANESKLVDALAQILGDKTVSAEGLSELLVTSKPADVSGLRQALDGIIAGSEDLDPELWGPAPSEHDLEVARERAAQAGRAALDAALADAWSRDEVAVHLGISPQAVSKQVANQRLISIRRAGQPRFPRWQFTAEGVVAGIPELMEAFDSPVALSSWATTPAADLDGRAPADVLRTRRGLDRVRELLVSVGPAAW